MIAALFVRSDNHYAAHGVDCYDFKRNALSEAMLAALQMDQPQAIVHRHNQVDPAPQLQVSGQASVPALAATR